MEFRVLGPLEVWEGDRLLMLGSPKQRTLLAVLLLHANDVVSTDQLINELWGERPPSTAANLLQCHVYQLRKALGWARGAQAAEPLLVTRPPGYLLRVEPDQIDLYRFERLVSEGGQALAEQDCAGASERLHTALALWRGPALAGIHSESVRQIEAARLQERYLAATEQRIEADLLLGRHAHLVAELQALVASYPLRERLHGQLMMALYRSGRRAEALQAYREARRVLIEGLGLDPGLPLQQLQRAILAADPALDLRDAGAPGGWRESEPSARPCQLPPDIGDFTGRDELVAELQRVVAREDSRQGTALVVAAIAGKAASARPRWPCASPTSCGRTSPTASCT
jgi:DNA-binding SARP family transcriptional activator